MQFVLYSGGLDGLVLLHWLRKRQQMGAAYRGAYDGEIIALTFAYGQRMQRQELFVSAAECRRLGIKQHIIPMEAPFRASASVLLSPGTALPSAHYADASQQVTEVPGRNAIFLSVAMSIAYAAALESGKVAQLYSGINWDPYQHLKSIYPDCRPEFISAAEQMVRTATEGRVHLSTPFGGLLKKEIIQAGLLAGLTLEDFGRSYSCYSGDEHACGVCAACTKRAAAFAKLGLADPALSAKPL